MQQKEACCQEGCQLCIKTREVQKMKSKGKRELSLQSIYRKDYHLLLNTPLIPLPKQMKNDSNLPSIAPTRFKIDSTYTHNFKELPAQDRSRPQIIPSNPQHSLSELVSTYNSDYRSPPQIHPQQSYKIADFEFYNIKSSSPKITEYAQRFKQRTVKRQKQQKQKMNEKHGKQIRLFDTTQKRAFKGEGTTDLNPSILPSNNMQTLPTSPTFFNSTYRQQFQANNPDSSSKNTHHIFEPHNGSRFSSLGSYYF